MALPFDTRIDWSEIAIKWPQSDAERLPTFLLGISQTQIRAKRAALLAVRHNFVWCSSGGAFTQLVDSLSRRRARRPALRKPVWRRDRVGSGVGRPKHKQAAISFWVSKAQRGACSPRAPRRLL